MIISNKYGLRAKILDTDKEFSFCKAGKRQIRATNALRGFATTKRYEYIETPDKPVLRQNYKIKFLDTGEEFRVVNWTEEPYNEIQVNYTQYDNVDIITVLELE